MLASQSRAAAGAASCSRKARGSCRSKSCRSRARSSGAELTAPQPLKKLTQFSADEAAACISLSAADIRTDRHAPLIVSVGLPFLVVEACFPRRAAAGRSPMPWLSRTRFRVDGSDAVYFYTRDVPPSRSALRPAGADVLSGIEAALSEDPATGSATVADRGTARRPRARAGWRIEAADRPGF